MHVHSAFNLLYVLVVMFPGLVMANTIPPLTKWSHSSCLPPVRGTSIAEVARRMVLIGNASAPPCGGTVICTNKMQVFSTSANGFTIESQCTGSTYFQPTTTECPPGFLLNGSGLCDRVSNQMDPDKQPDEECPTSPSSGNPIQVFTGNKYQQEILIPEVQANDLRFSLRYISDPTLNSVSAFSSFGGYWRSNYDRYLSIGTNLVVAIRQSGASLYFSDLSGVWSTDSDIKETLKFDSGQWLLTTLNNIEERYSSAGRLISITDRSGLMQILSYDISSAEGGDDNPHTLDRVEDNDNRYIAFSYDSSARVSKLADQDGNEFRFAYDNFGMLVHISYPDATPSSDGTNPFGGDNPFQTFHYNESAHIAGGANFPRALTGITDELGNRFATWKYDEIGRASSSLHAKGAGLTTLDYTHIDNPSNPRVIETNELGKVTTYHYTTLHGSRKVSLIEGHASANCAASNKTYTYYPNGLIETQTDWSGNVTYFEYSARGLVTKKIEAQGTPEERTTLTDWHADWNLAIKITQPDRVIDMTYDADGLLLERQETPMSLNGI